MNTFSAAQHEPKQSAWAIPIHERGADVWRRKTTVIAVIAVSIAPGKTDSGIADVALPEVGVGDALAIYGHRCFTIEFTMGQTNRVKP